MSSLQIEMAIAAVILLILIIAYLSKNRMSVRNSIAWLLLPIVFFLIAIFPEPLTFLANFFGFETLANFIFLIVIALLIIICFFLTITISHDEELIKKLTEEVSILKAKDEQNNKSRKKTQ